MDPLSRPRFPVQGRAEAFGAAASTVYILLA